MSCQAWLHASSLRNIKSLPPTCRVFWLDQALHLHVLRERPTDLVRHRPRGWPYMACMNMSCWAMVVRSAVASTRPTAACAHAYMAPMCRGSRFFRVNQRHDATLTRWAHPHTAPAAGALQAHSAHRALSMHPSKPGMTH